MNTKIDPKKIVLGTAQLGSNYGVMNRNNKNDRKNINLILEKAWEYGIRCFDTAPGYKSERLIGDFVKAHGLNDDIKVLTKVSSLNSINIEKEISKSIEISIKNLNCPISVLFLHDPDDAKLLLKDQDMFIRLMEYFEIKDIGASVYDIETIHRLSEISIPLAFQYPMNFLDRRFENVKMNIGKRYARSIFLQGLLSSNFLTNKTIPTALVNLHKAYHEYANHINLDPYSLALSYIIHDNNTDFILIGIDNTQQLDDLFEARLVEKDMIKNLHFNYTNINKKTLDPRNWMMD